MGAVTSLHVRLMAVAMILPLVWLAEQAAMLGVAGIYGDSVTDLQRALSKTGDTTQRRHYIAQAEDKLARARGIYPRNSGFYLLAADLAAAARPQEPEPEARIGSLQDSIGLMHQALRASPVQADIWSRLAGYHYELQGPSPAALYALDRAMLLGPREYGSLMINATVILNSGGELDTARRLRGWNSIVEAAAIPDLSRKIISGAKSAGLERQLRSLIRDKAKQGELLQKRRAAHADEG